MSPALCTYPGGKRQLAPRLLPLIPKHVCYVEPFCGAAGLFFSKPPSQVEVLNDINSELVNAFRCVRHHVSAVIEELMFRINSRADFKSALRCAKCDNNAQTDVHRAADFLFCRALSFGAEGLSFGVTKSKVGGASSSLSKVRADLLLVAQRLNGVNIENRSFEACIETYDSPDTFFFCDPPYIGCQSKSYKNFTLAEFAALVDLLRGRRGQWMLTINDLPEVRKVIRGLRVRRMERGRAIKSATRYAELCVTSVKSESK